MTNNHKKSKHRKIGVFVGVSTTLFSICGPILQTVAIAEETNQLSSNKISRLPDVTSVINYDTEFTSNLDSSSIEETSNSSIEQTEETSNSTEETTTSETSSSSSSTIDSSQTSNSSSTSSSTSNSSSFSSSSSSSKTPDETTNTSSKEPTSSSSKTDDLIGKNIKEDKTPISYTRNQTTAEFIEEINEDARAIGQNKDLYASVMIAQAILESGSGNSGLAKAPNYNLFGIKGSYEGSSVQMATLEDNGSGSMYTVNAKFRKYPSYKESLEDYAT